MRKDNSHLAASGRWFQLYAGPQVPNPGPTPPILETTVPNDSINPTPSNIIISCPTTSTNIYRKVNAKTEFLTDGEITCLFTRMGNTALGCIKCLNSFLIILASTT